MERSATMLTELDKVKKDVRMVKSDKNTKKSATSPNLEDFRKRAMTSVTFVEENMSKLRSILAGERDAPPTDLGKCIF